MNEPNTQREGLQPQHKALIEASGISEEVARQRGYRTVTDVGDPDLSEFADYQRRVPALLVPIYGPGGWQTSTQIRPDNPRLDKDGHPIKYETPSGARMHLDVPPAVRKDLRDPRRSLVITEGVRKADSAVSRGIACVALLGVWNWKGTNAYGGTTALGEWDDLHLKERNVYVCFDSDISTNKGIRDAAERLGEFLRSRKARVRYIVLPPTPDGGKQGMDDFFAAGHTKEDLFAHVVDELPLVLKWERPKSIGEWYAEPEEETEYIVEDLLPMRGSSLLSARPKVGKTVTVRNLIADVLRGSPAFGRKTTQGPVLYLAVEEMKSEALNHFRKLGVGPEDHLYVHFGAAPDEAMAWLTWMISEVQPVLAVIDTLQLFMRLRDNLGNDYNAVTNAMAPLNQLARDTRAHIMTVHHNTKGNDDPLGSIGFVGNVDSVLVMRRNGDTRTIECTDIRYGRELPQTVLTLDTETGRVTAEEEYSKTKEEAAVEAVLEAMQEGEVLTRDEIVERAVGDTNELKRAITRLTNWRLRRTGGGKRGDPFLFEKMPEDWVPTGINLTVVR